MKRKETICREERGGERMGKQEKGIELCKGIGVVKDTSTYGKGIVKGGKGGCK